jgi:hypothetical protein
MVKSVDTEQQLNLMGELVLLNKEGIQLSIASRMWVMAVHTADT